MAINGEWNTVLEHISTSEPLLWVLDVETLAIVGCTPASAEFPALLGSLPELRTLSEQHHLEVARNAVSTGRSETVFEWMKYDAIWRKVARISIPVSGNHVLVQLLDITRFDPRAEWLARINLVSQRLELDSGMSISFAEFVVLHLLLKGLKHSRIAQILNIGIKTVDYRISRLKIALETDTTEEMMSKVTASGLIYLALVPIDLANPAQTELELYKKVPG
ncbi:MAG: hypothetical protein KDI33_18220 [Halioglobus sp.]|nr:hypothetical protein [Halioglobus sp.]